MTRRTRLRSPSPARAAARLTVSGVALAVSASVLPPLVGPVHAAAPTATESFAASSSLAQFVPDGPGSWAVAAGRLRLTRPAGAVAPASAVHTTSVTGDFSIAAQAGAAQSSDPDLSLLFAWKGPADYSYLHLDSVTSRSGLYRVAAGVRTRLAAAAATVLPGRSYRMEVRRVGSSLKAYANECANQNRADLYPE